MDAIRMGRILFLAAWILFLPGLAVTASGDESAAEKRGRMDPPSSTASRAQDPLGTSHSATRLETSNTGLRLSRRFDLRWDARAQDQVDALMLEAGEIIEASAFQGNPAPKVQGAELRADVRLQLQDKSMLAKADRAVITVRYQDTSRTTVESLTVKLSGNIQWSFGEISMTADTLTLRFRQSPKEKTTKPRTTDWTVTGRARLNGKDFAAQADRVELTRDMDEGGQAVHVKLDGNAVVKYRENLLRASQVELWPSRHAVRAVNK